MKLKKRNDAPLKRFQRMGGALDFLFFENVVDYSVSPHACLANALKIVIKDESFDEAALRRIDPKKVRIKEFFGDWYDPKTKRLLQKGVWTTSSGKELRDPLLSELDKYEIVGGGVGLPGIGDVGNFAYAYLCPPYPLNASRDVIERTFAEIVELIQAEDPDTLIHSWNDDRLPTVSSYFNEGAEWWGCFLFTLHNTTADNLWVILGSTTD